jgi:hypothetical protein
MGYCFNEKEQAILIFKFCTSNEILNLTLKMDGGKEIIKL